MPKKVFISFIKLYKITISPFLKPRCRFYPTCSTYSIQAIEKHSIVKGLLLSIYRILKCHPFSKGGYDPVE